MSIPSIIESRSGGPQGRSRTAGSLIVRVNVLTQAITVRAVPGLITYKVFSVQQFAKRKALQTAVSENAENEADVGIASLNALMGAF
jgi:hypothetical protein